MTTVAKLRKDLEVIKRAIAPKEEDTKAEAIIQSLKGYDEYMKAFRELPEAEQDRFIRELEDTPDSEFVSSEFVSENKNLPNLPASYGEAFKSATIHDLKAAKARGKHDDGCEA